MPALKQYTFNNCVGSWWEHGQQPTCQEKLRKEFWVFFSAHVTGKLTKLECWVGFESGGGAHPLLEMPGRSSAVLSCWYWVVSFCIPRGAWSAVRGGRSRAACSGVMPVNTWPMVAHLGLSVLVFNWAGTLIQHKLLWAFQFPQIKASAESFFQSAGRFSSTTVCEVLFVYPSDSIFCALLDCCEEKSQVLLRGCPGQWL